MDNFEFENKKKKKLRREPLYISICIMCLAIGAIGGYFYSASLNEKSAKENIDEYTEIRTIIEDLFVDTTKSEHSLKDRMLAGMVAGLGDKYTQYMSTKANDQFQTSINGSFVGIGLLFNTIEEGALVSEVYKGTPAFNAGIQNGDIITHVQGTSVAGYDSDKIRDVIVGEKGSEVTLRIIRNGKTQDIQTLRDDVDTSLSYEIRTSQQQKIGYIRLTTFGNTTVDLFEDALKEMKSQNVDVLCIDLRQNSGGYLHVAKEILDMLIPKGEVLYKEQEKGKDAISVKATDRDKYKFEKGFIIGDGGSASASEVTAGCLMDQLEYKLVGTKTYGKGLVQTQVTLKDSSVLKYTNARWLTPKGVCVQGEGIKPTYEVKQKELSDFNYISLEKSFSYDQVDVNIQYMQEILKELGYSVDRTDGYFSTSTSHALKQFEKKYNLKVNGSLDKDDAIILLSVLSNHVYHLEDRQYQKVEELIK